MTRPYPIMFELQQLTVDLSLIDRKHYLPQTKRNENDLEHSFTVALLCWYLHEKLQIEIDIALVLKYAMAHDFVERYAGDVPSFASEQARKEKIVQEQQALTRLSSEFAEFADLAITMQRYEEKQDEESLFVWTVDKIQQLIMGDLDNWACYVEGEISYERFVDKYTEIAQRGSKYCREIFDTIIEYCKTTYPVKL
jgi:putative hydrolases of HD superfamily